MMPFLKRVAGSRLTTSRDVNGRTTSNNATSDRRRVGIHPRDRISGVVTTVNDVDAIDSDSAGLTKGIGSDAFCLRSGMKSIKVPAAKVFRLHGE
jgi:hypothetical protein